MRTLAAFLLAMTLGGCAAWDRVVHRPPTPCEKLCDRVFPPGQALAVPDGPARCVCWYQDPFEQHNQPRFGLRSRSGTAWLECKPDCATAADQLKPKP